MAQISQVIPLPSSKTAKLWLPLTIILGAGGILISLIFAILIYQVIYLDRVYPGVSVMGTDVSGMTQPEVVATLDQKLPDYLAQTVTVRDGKDTWTYTGQQLGIRVDVAILANKAYAIGREGNFLSDLRTQLKLLTTPQEVEPLLWYDTGPGNYVLQELAEKIYRLPRDAQLIIHPDARVEVIPAQWGRQMHTEATRTLIEAALFSKSQEPVEVITQEIIPGLTNVEIARQQAENLLQQSLTFSVETAEETRRWQMEPPTLASLLDLTETVDGYGQANLAITLDPDEFTPFLEQIATAVQQEPVDAQLNFDTEKNEVVVLQPSGDGYSLDWDETYQQISHLLDNPGQPVKLALTVTPPAVSSQDIDSLGIKALVSESTSYFKGSSEGRMHNIALAASKFDRVVIPPGEIFSFNKYLGDVSQENGYDESLIIFGNRTTVGIGGGVCQVSTTVFRTAFLGGLEIVERWAHGYRVSWYEINSEPGLDATVYTPDVDFKFRNDTDHYLLIQTKTDLEAGTLTFRFYGTPTEREVIVSKPAMSNLVKAGAPVYEEDALLTKGMVKQVDWANDGLDVTVTRLVKDGDKVLHEDTIVSRYRPWKAVYKVGTGGAPPGAANRVVR